MSVVKGTYSAYSSGNYGGDLEFHTRAADGLGLKQRMTIAHDGNVGIGTTSPTSILYVAKQLTSPSVPMVRFAATRSSSAYGTVNVGVDNLDFGYGMRFYRSGTYDTTGYGS